MSKKSKKPFMVTVDAPVPSEGAKQDTVGEGSCIRFENVVVLANNEEQLAPHVRGVLVVEEVPPSSAVKQPLCTCSPDLDYCFCEASG